MALFRNLAIGLIRLAGRTQIKQTLEHLAADRTRILPLLAASAHDRQDFALALLVVVEEVRSGDWGIGGNSLTTEVVHALQRGAAG